MSSKTHIAITCDSKRFQRFVTIAQLLVNYGRIDAANLADRIARPGVELATVRTHLVPGDRTNLIATIEPTMDFVETIGQAIDDFAMLPSDQKKELSRKAICQWVAEYESIFGESPFAT